MYLHAEVDYPEEQLSQKYKDLIKRDYWAARRNQIIGNEFHGYTHTFQVQGLKNTEFSPEWSPERGEILNTPSKNVFIGNSIHVPAVDVFHRLLDVVPSGIVQAKMYDVLSSKEPDGS